MENKKKVLSTPLTCFAALSPIIANNLNIYYSDINTSDFNLDTSLIRNKKTKDINSVILNYFGGTPFEINEFIDYAKSNNITIIEDCAQSLGGEIDSCPLGAFGDHSFFSFTKHFSLVGGGLLASRNKSLINRVRRYQRKLPSVPISLLDYRLKRDVIEKNLGDEAFNKSYEINFLSKQNEYEEKDPRINFFKTSVLSKPIDLQAAVILNQFERLSTLIAKRRYNAKEITDKIGTMKNISPQKIFGQSAYAKYYIKTTKPNEEVINYLNTNGIDAKQLTKSHGFYMQAPINKTKYYYDSSIENCNNYMNIFNNILELPLSSNMNRDEINSIVKHLRVLFNE